ncbi:MAG TPA: carboxypeptidase-like regulatory domain-containing protein, partial [Terriglobales bacterium]|nr:carboxypeptidase-like regulatory domain-containing protein [Terriglobales bacterium]
MKAFPKFVLVVLSLLLLSLMAFGQAVSGDLVGSVTDQSGAVIANATVTAIHVATGVRSETRTNASGDFRFTNLPVGSYNLTIKAIGFTTAQVKDVRVELNQTIASKIQLQVGQVETVVEVSAAAAAVDTSTAQLQTTFETNEVQNLPTAANNAGSGVLNLALLDAGVGTSGGLGAGSGPSVSGQRPRNNNFTIEG